MVPKCAQKLPKMDQKGPKTDQKRCWLTLQNIWYLLYRSHMRGSRGRSGRELFSNLLLGRRVCMIFPTFWVFGAKRGPKLDSPFATEWPKIAPNLQKVPRVAPRPSHEPKRVPRGTKMTPKVIPKTSKGNPKLVDGCSPDHCFQPTWGNQKAGRIDLHSKF